MREQPQPQQPQPQQQQPQPEGERMAARGGAAAGAPRTPRTEEGAVDIQELAKQSITAGRIRDFYSLGHVLGK